MNASTNAVRSVTRVLEKHRIFCRGVCEKLLLADGVNERMMADELRALLGLVQGGQISCADGTQIVDITRSAINNSLGSVGSPFCGPVKLMGVEHYRF